MDIQRAIDFAKEFTDKHPEHIDEVRDMFDLMKDEIEAGESQENEINLFIGACEDLLIEED
jgi:hypothetical protein